VVSLDRRASLTRFSSFPGSTDPDPANPDLPEQSLHPGGDRRVGSWTRVIVSDRVEILTHNGVSRSRRLTHEYAVAGTDVEVPRDIGRDADVGRTVVILSLDRVDLVPISSSWNIGVTRIVTELRDPVHISKEMTI
jgi:hypothetical protein